MKTIQEIKERIAECNGEIRRLDNKDTLFSGCLSAEEYEVMDSLCSEYAALRWVLE